MPTLIQPMGSAVAPYKVTAEDVLWLRRAVEAEGAPRTKVARALVNLFAMRRAAGSTITLASLVRAYAQPVNPRWARGGDLWQAQYAKAATLADRHVLEAQAERRRVAAARTVFGEETDRAVMDALGGEHYTDVTDYAAPNVDGAAKGYVARSESSAGENRMWTRKPGWPGYVAESSTAGKVDAWAMVAVVAVVAAVLMAR